VKENKDSKIGGAIGTIVYHVILLLLLMFFGFSKIVPTEEEGLTVNFGTSDEGSGFFEPAPQSEIEDMLEPEALTAPPATSTPIKQERQEELVTQNNEESVAIQEEKRKKKEEQQRIIEQRKIVEEQRKAEEKRIAEAKRIQDEKAKKASAAAKNAFGSGGKGSSTTSKGEGITSGTGNQGNPFGDVNSKNRIGGGTGNGHSFSLSGRSIVGSIPQPSYNSNEEGAIVVDIEVDKNGNVISAHAGGKGTTIGDNNMRKAAENAAKRAKFNGITGNITQTGSITYRYNLR